jgi:hypothetical protein
MKLKTSPPSHPNIPIGLGTVTGLGATATMWFVALVTAVLDGDHTGETRTTLIVGGATLLVTLLGRFAQAVAAIIAAKYGVVIPQEDEPEVKAEAETYGDDYFETDPASQETQVIQQTPADDPSVRAASGDHPQGDYYPAQPEGAVQQKPLERTDEGRFQS